jgi:hypothetical protein
MLAYLAQGWFSSHATHPHRPEVLDGALDSASSLYQAGLQASTVRHVGHKLRRALPNTMPLGLAEPNALLGHVSWETLRESMLTATDDHVVLQSFVMDGLAAVVDLMTLAALCLHLQHIAQHMELLERLGPSPMRARPQAAIAS